ncbi:hypothetical protein Plim_3914 [Planctopirus limnophila DSM 3776]|uniref:Uncharacterized protein n=1 Tax=Planctopirus limnophila (strain ATCC 43296 / DSM 3776 / IFAM 1008 / Mu 290) TaxID=521674 RepID=D5SXA3_PLAL2|nr:hypothetical protein [Planctopirus limnophila]ADG69725.1 hypothetical protein Plim_3914 [Planctopirus limnophila DSM 3776]
MQINLEVVDAVSRPAIFRVAYSGAEDRCLLQYPQVYDLQFLDPSENIAAEWGTRFLTSGPLDDFVLAPGSRIAFDLFASINSEPSTKALWSIELPSGNYSVRFVYHFEGERDWYDFLAKRSRFAAVTPIWRGTMISNTVSLMITDGSQ